MRRHACCGFEDNTGEHSRGDDVLRRMLLLGAEHLGAEAVWICRPQEGGQASVILPVCRQAREGGRSVIDPVTGVAAWPLGLAASVQDDVLCFRFPGREVLSPACERRMADYAALVGDYLRNQGVTELRWQLQEGLARYHAIFDSAVDGIISITDRGLIDTMNPAAVKMFGYSLEELRGRNISQLMPEPYASEHDGYLENYRMTGRERIIGIGREVQGRRRDGTLFPLELAVSRMQLGDRMMFTGMVKDITERKHIEKLKAEFVSMVSHELRTPLTSIRGALSLVLGKYAQGLPDKARQLLLTANRNSERLTTLINDILDLEKIESGGLEFQMAVVDLRQQLELALAANEGYALQHQVRLRQAGMPPGDARAYLDESRLQQVFSNLISNAIKYSPADGQVEISLALVDDRWRIAVRDHGAGIPEHFRSRLFQRFSQADSSSQRAQGGTGLGLSITKAIVERMGGSITYWTEAGEGTEFRVDFPVWLDIREHEPAEDPLYPVLLCEDNPDVAGVLAQLLLQEGFSCDIASTGAATRQLLARKRYHALLLDLTLPDMDGLDLLRELRADPAHDRLPVIVVSGRAGEGKASLSASGVAVVDWLQKPVDEQRLGRALSQVRRHAMRPCILHVEDEPDIIQVVKPLVEEVADYVYAPTLAEARRLIAARAFDLVLLDLTLPDGSGASLLEDIGKQTPVVVFSALDAANELSSQVCAALTKSRTSHERLLQTIRQWVLVNAREKSA